MTSNIKINHQMLTIFYQILPLFLIILFGGIFGYFNKNFNDKTVAELNRYAYYVGFPMIIINSFLSIESIPKLEIEIAFVNVGILTAFMFLIIWITGKIFKNQRLQNTYFVCAIFGNVAYLGFPLVYAINPNYSTSLSLHIAGYLLVLFTLGIARLEISKNNGAFDILKLGKSIALNPLLLGTFIGIVITILGISMPDIGKRTIGMLAASASPVVLFALGIFIAKNKIVTSSLAHASAISILKLLLLPLIFFGFSMTILTDYTMTVSIIMAAMPVAITPFVLSEIYDMDKKIIVSAIIMSTILASLWLPLVIDWA
jgi:predicted permease